MADKSASPGTPAEKSRPVNPTDSEERKERRRDERSDEDAELTSRRASDERKYRARSRSPDRPRQKTKRPDAGFKWKTRRGDEDVSKDRGEGLKRGYKDYYRPRSRSRSPRRPREPPRELRERHQDKSEATGKKEKKEKRPAPAAPQQEMIVVYVNDRLGTKKAIPCFPTDPIKDFKVIVASMIGRQPHEILLKRQGERPFKDFLTLQDYGVSNNVQLDLEVDTGD